MPRLQQNRANIRPDIGRGWSYWNGPRTAYLFARNRVPGLSWMIRSRETAHAGAQLPIVDYTDVNGNQLYDYHQTFWGRGLLYSCKQGLGNLMYRTGARATARYIDSNAGLSGENRNDVQTATACLSSLNFTKDSLSSESILNNANQCAYSKLIGKKGLDDQILEDLDILERNLFDNHGNFDFLSTVCKNVKVLDNVVSLAFHSPGLVNYAYPINKSQEKAKQILWSAIAAHGDRGKVDSNIKNLVENFIEQFGRSDTDVDSEFNNIERTNAILGFISNMPRKPGVSFHQNLSEYLADIRSSYGGNVGGFISSILMREILAFEKNPFSPKYLGNNEFTYSDPPHPTVNKALNMLREIWSSGLPNMKTVTHWKINTEGEYFHYTSAVQEKIDWYNEPLVQRFKEIMSLPPAHPRRDELSLEMHEDIAKRYLKHKELLQEKNKWKDHFEAVGSVLRTKEAVYLPVEFANEDQLTQFLTDRKIKSESEIEMILGGLNPATETAKEALIKLIRENAEVDHIPIVPTREQLRYAKEKYDKALALVESFEEGVIRLPRLAIDHASKLLPGFSAGVIHSLAFQDYTDLEGNVHVGEFFSKTDSFVKDYAESLLQNEIKEEKKLLDQSVCNKLLVEEERRTFDRFVKNNYANTLDEMGTDIESIEEFYKRISEKGNVSVHNDHFSEFRDAYTRTGVTIDEQNLLKARLFTTLIYELSRTQRRTQIYRLNDRNNPFTLIKNVMSEVIFEKSGGVAPVPVIAMQRITEIEKNFSNPSNPNENGATNYREFCRKIGDALTLDNRIAKIDKTIEQRKDRITILETKDIADPKFRQIEDLYEKKGSALVKDIYLAYGEAFSDMARSHMDENPDFVYTLRGFLVEFVNALFRYTGVSHKNKVLDYLEEAANEYITAGAISARDEGGQALREFQKGMQA